MRAPTNQLTKALIARLKADSDVASLSMSIFGEGVLAEQSVEKWLDAFYSKTAIKVKVECVFPAKKVTFTGEMHLESF